MNLTKTWLNSIIEGVIEIEGYNNFRSGRKNREGEGIATYIYDKIEAK